MFRVLLICTGNTCRSPMAEALLNACARAAGQENAVRATSAGVAALPDCPASPEAVEALAARGISLAGHRSRVLTLAMLAEADLILTMTARHSAAVLQVAPQAWEKVYTLAQYAARAGEVADPFGKDARAYALCAEELTELVGAAWEKIAAHLQVKGERK